MRTLSIILIPFALLTFSGCYTQLLIEGDPAPVQKIRPVFAIPAPVVITPVATDPVLVVTPDPIYYPVNNPEPITGYSNPAGSGQPAATVQRTSGVQRSIPAASQPSSENNSRNSGTTRGKGR